MKYVGQTGRSYRVRFQEHHRDFRYNNSKSKFAVHLIENEHSMGHIDNLMEILYINRKGRIMDTTEKYYTYKETKEGNQINDKNTVKQNKIYDALIQGKTGRSRARN